jgi:hypothetical protein
MKIDRVSKISKEARFIKVVLCFFFYKLAKKTEKGQKSFMSSCREFPKLNSADFVITLDELLHAVNNGK